MSLFIVFQENPAQYTFNGFLVPLNYITVQMIEKHRFTESGQYTV